MIRNFNLPKEIKNFGLDEDEEKKSIDYFAIKLESNGLFKFQNRIFYKFLNCTHLIKTHPNVYSQLKEEVNTQFDENLDNGDKYEKDVYELKSCDLI